MDYTEEQLSNMINLTEKEIKNLLEIKDDDDRLDAMELLIEEKVEIPEGEEEDLFPELINYIESRLETDDTEDTSELQKLIQVTQMGIVHEGSSVDEQELSTVKLEGDITVRNPNPNLFDGGNLSSELNAETNLGFNLKRIKSIIEVKEDVDVEVGETFNLNVERLIGIMDASKADQRRAIYDYWRKIQQNRFPQFIDSKDALAKTIESSDIPQELKDKFSKIMDDYQASDLNYIAKFPLAKAQVQETQTRFFNIVSTVIYTKRYLQNARGKDIVEGDESEAGDISGQLAQEFLDAIGTRANDIYDRGVGSQDEFLQATSIDPDDTGLDDLEYIDERPPEELIIDPLLAYENTRGEKLIAITREEKQYSKIY